MISLQDLWKQQQEKVASLLRDIAAWLEPKKEDPHYVKAAMKELQNLNSQQRVLNNMILLIYTKIGGTQNYYCLDHL